MEDGRHSLPPLDPISRPSSTSTQHSTIHHSNSLPQLPGLSALANIASSSNSSPLRYVGRFYKSYLCFQEDGRHVELGFIENLAVASGSSHAGVALCCCLRVIEIPLCSPVASLTEDCGCVCFAFPRFRIFIEGWSYVSFSFRLQIELVCNALRPEKIRILLVQWNGGPCLIFITRLR